MLNRRNTVVLFSLLLLLTALSVAQTQAPAPAAAPPGAQKGTMLLTIFLKHDQAKPLDKINAELKAQGYYKAFPPPGTEVVSWYVVMGIGQVVTLRFPAEQLRAVNVALERTAWGPYRTEFFPTYDYKAIAEQQARDMNK